MNRYISKSTKDKVYKRAKGFCEYCLSPFEFLPSPYNIEHIIPISKGGSNELENLALSCFGCNLKKLDKLSGIDPLTKQETKLYNPRVDKWTTHFTWNKDFTLIIGQTKIGRTSIFILKLNRNELINLRALLVVFGEMPPKHL